MVLFEILLACLELIDVLKMLAILDRVINIVTVVFFAGFLGEGYCCEQGNSK